MPKVTYERIGVVQSEEANLRLLDVSLTNQIPHYHACGGLAKCSTCRVLVVSGSENLTDRTEAEETLAKKKGFDDRIRLACQARVKGDIVVRRLVLDNIDAKTANTAKSKTGDMCLGNAMQVAVLFSDIRGFTPFSENHYPYDVMHILNRYLYGVGEAIHRYNGYIDKYMGDGVMALFGIEGEGPNEASNNALFAALDMIEELKKFNIYLYDQFEERFQVGIGIHVGEVVVGEMGHPDRRQLTALGDVVNTASRIESATKTYQAQILVSQEVLAYTKNKVEVGQVVNATLKGKSTPLTLTEVIAHKTQI